MASASWASAETAVRITTVERVDLFEKLRHMRTLSASEHWTHAASERNRRADDAGLDGLLKIELPSHRAVQKFGLLWVSAGLALSDCSLGAITGAAQHGGPSVGSSSGALSRRTLSATALCSWAPCI
jgi:hypothetical protein